jgi:hypothetical protein
MRYAELGFGCKNISGRRIEELHDGSILERWGVGHIDNYLSASDRFFQPLACNRF